MPEWAIADVARVLKVSEDELVHGPREADPRLAVNVSGAYTGLDIEIASRVSAHFIYRLVVTYGVGRP
jgi:hypothetical protein